MYQTIAKAEAFIMESGGRTAALQPSPEACASTQHLPQHPQPPTPLGLPLQVSRDQSHARSKGRRTARTLVELFGEGHQWADIKAYFNTGEAARVAFSAVTDLDFNTAGEYAISCIADYRLSEKTNSKGNPYKNLVAVRLA